MLPIKPHPPCPSQAEELKPGSVVVTFTKGLESACFEVVSKKRFEMSWGEEIRNCRAPALRFYTHPSILRIPVVRCSVFRIPHSEFGVVQYSVVLIPYSALFSIPYSALRIRHCSVFRSPHSVFGIVQYSVFHIPYSVLFCIR